MYSDGRIQLLLQEHYCTSNYILTKYDIKLDEKNSHKYSGFTNIINIYE